MTHDDDSLAAAPEGGHLSLLEAHLAALCEVGNVLSRSLDLHEVVNVLNERNRLTYGMICEVDPQTGELLVSAPHSEVPQPFEAVRCRPGEG